MNDVMLLDVILQPVVYYFLIYFAQGAHDCDGSHLAHWRMLAVCFTEKY